MSLSVTGAFIDSEKTLQLAFNTTPIAASPIGDHDALNPLSWQIYRQRDGLVYTVLAVRQVDSLTFQPFILQKFDDFNTTHVVDVSRVTDASFNPPSPATANMGGCVAYTAARTSVGTVDLANVPFSGSASISGTLKTTSSGDYATQGGLDLLKKLIYRRLTTTPGDFFYLPGYGLGIREKQLYSPAALAALKVNIEKQVQIEPEVSSCTAQLTLGSNNILTIQLLVTLTNNNQQIPLSIPVKVV